MGAVSGFDSFLERVKDLTGYDLPHPGYHLYQCIVCGEWSIDDYCGEQMGPITAEAAHELNPTAGLPRD